MRIERLHHRQVRTDENQEHGLGRQVAIPVLYRYLKPIPQNKSASGGIIEHLYQNK